MVEILSIELVVCADIKWVDRILGYAPGRLHLRRTV